MSEYIKPAVIIFVVVLVCLLLLGEDVGEGT